MIFSLWLDPRWASRCGRSSGGPQAAAGGSALEPGTLIPTLARSRLLFWGFAEHEAVKLSNMAASGGGQGPSGIYEIQTLGMCV